MNRQLSFSSLFNTQDEDLIQKTLNDINPWSTSKLKILQPKKKNIIQQSQKKQKPIQTFREPKQKRKISKQMFDFKLIQLDQRPILTVIVQETKQKRKNTMNQKIPRLQKIHSEPNLNDIQQKPVKLKLEEIKKNQNFNFDLNQFFNQKGIINLQNSQINFNQIQKQDIEQEPSQFKIQAFQTWHNKGFISGELRNILKLYKYQIKPFQQKKEDKQNS